MVAKNLKGTKTHYQIQTLSRMVQLPATAAMSPLVVELELERERKLERKLKVSEGLMPVPPSSMRIGFLCL